MISPRPALLELGPFALRPLVPGDAPFVHRLGGAGHNRLVVELPGSVAECRAYLEELGSSAWALPMACTRQGVDFGLCFTALSNLHSLNGYLLALFEEPRQAGPALALYVRHAFWSFPLRRFYVQFPLTDPPHGYEQLYPAAGFAAEGVMAGHALLGGREHDVATFGLLRSDFDRWCQQREPRLAL